VLYQIGLEDVEPDHWVAWVFALPGCYTSAASPAEAVATTPTAIAGHKLWLERQGHGVQGADQAVEIELVEVFHSFLVDGDYRVNAFFEEDRPPLTRDEVEHASWLLARSREELLASARPVILTQPGDAVPIDVHESIRAILAHVAGAERWYFQNLSLGQPSLVDDPLVALDQVRAQTRACVAALVGDGRICVVRGEQWSARKALRRTLWHERDHVRQIKSVIRQSMGARS
jgi:predicted RNase H-like HicB family nuclease